MIYGKNREKNKIDNINIDKDKDIDVYVAKYMDIVNDKSELVNKLGELLDSIMVEVQNVVKNNDYDNLLKNLKKWKINISKLIKPDTSEKKYKPNTSEKKYKPNTSKKKDKPNTSVKKDKPNTSVKKDKPNTSKKKDDIKEYNTSEKKDDIKKYNKTLKTLNSIEKIFKRFICEKFMNEKYHVKVDKDSIVFYLIRKPIKGFKMKHMTEISKDIITLATEKETKSMNEFITICIIDN